MELLNEIRFLKKQNWTGPGGLSPSFFKNCDIEADEIPGLCVDWQEM